MTTAPTGRGPEVVELAPVACVNGHRLTRGNVLIGWDPGRDGGRTYLCRTCGMQTLIRRDGSSRHDQKAPG